MLKKNILRSGKQTKFIRIASCNKRKKVFEENVNKTEMNISKIIIRVNA